MGAVTPNTTSVTTTTTKLTQTHKRKAIVAAHLSALMSSNVAPLAPDRRILKATRVQNPLEEGDGAGGSKGGLPNAIVISDDSKTRR